MPKKIQTSEFHGKTILLVHAGSEGKYFIAKRLHQLGLRVVCLNRDRVAALDEYVDEWIIADLSNSAESLQAIRTFLISKPEFKFDGVVTFWDEAVLLTSRIVDAFHLIGIPSRVAETVKNKFVFRSFCEKGGLPAPKHHILHSKKDIPSLEKKLSYPMVIKPMYGAASAYVVKVFDRQDLEETYDYVKNNMKSFWLAPEWENLEVFVEEYIDGDEVDMDILLQNGKIKFYCISDNFNKSREKFFVDSGQSLPSSLPADQQDALITMAEEILEKLGIQNACIHFEAKYAKNGPCPIEVNMRMGGDYVYSYVKSAWKVDLVESAAAIALGIYIKIDKPQNPYRYIVGWDLQPEASGMLTALEISPELKKKSYLQEMYIVREVGDAILRPPEGYESLGWLTVSGNNLLDAKDNLEEALSLINYRVVEFDEESALGKTARKNTLSTAIIKKNLLLQAEKIERVRRVATKSQRQLKIGIAGNKVHGGSKLASGATPLTSLIREVLEARGYETAVFDFNNLAKAFTELRTSRVDFIFNVTDGLDNDSHLQPQAAALLEALQIPFTGTSSTNLSLCRDKIRLKKLFSYHELPTPAWDYAYRDSDSIDDKLRYPLLVKPGNTDNSVGISNASVVTDKKMLRKQMAFITKNLGHAVLVEEYLDGDEYEVSIIGNDEGNIQVLPLTRSIFTAMPKGYWHIYPEEKRQAPSPAYKKIIRQNPLRDVSPKLQALITEIALDAYKIAQCRDYGRVDIRLDKEDNPHVLEVDPNPPLSVDSEFVKAAKVAGLDYGDLLEEIIAAATQRYQKVPYWF